ncbi:Nuc1p [Saccharomyces cerevisiae YJM689]|nr:Nuc1p [Saccharomyces cerevisiae YJM689]
MCSRILLSGLVGLGAGTGLTYLLLNRHSPTQIIETPYPPTQKPNSNIQSHSFNVDPSGFFKYGFPGPIHDLQNREEFISCYNRQTQNPYWVLEHITPESLAARNADRKNSFFKEDEVIPEKFRGKLRDYFRSGYDRGHQAPAADAKFSQQAMDDTFYLSNMCPQVGEGFNRDYWAHLEYFCRGLTKKYKSVRIVTGPLYLPKKDPIDNKFRVNYEVIGNPPSIAVPTHFFKLIVAEAPTANPAREDIAIAAFVLPNEPISNETKLTDFEVPIDALERSTGLELLQKVPPSKKKALCKEVNCQIVVRDFSNAAIKQSKDVKLLPPPKKRN